MTPGIPLRGRRLASALAGALVVAAALLAARCGGSPAQEPPNVLVLVMDTARADHCSVAGGPRPTTPRLDRLAATGVRYRQAWSPAGWTAPAHASLFTGLRPRHHGVAADARMFLADSFPTLADLLRDAGWETACYTNNDWIGPTTGLSRGFDTFVPLYKDEYRGYPWCRTTHDQALDWALTQHRAGKRFFLFVNDMEPHLPYSPPDDFARRFLPADATQEEVAEGRAFDFAAAMHAILTGEMPSPRRMEILRSLYDAEIATLDASIGDLLDGLAREGVLDRTLVVVCGDHGENLADHGLMDHRFSLHRSICRVPLVVRLPGRFDGGRTVEDVVRLEDVFPTILQACGVAPPEHVDGVSLSEPTAGRVSLATQGVAGEFLDSARRIFPAADLTPFEVGLRAAFDGRFHYVRRSDGREEMYDVRADPDETRDLAPQGGPDLERLRALAEDA